MKKIYWLLLTFSLIQISYSQVNGTIPTIENMLSSKKPVDTKILKRMAKFDSGSTTTRTNNLIKTKFFQAQEYFNAKSYDKALKKIDEIESLTGNSLMIESQDLKVKCLIGAEKFEEANIELYLLQGLGLTEDQLFEAAKNASLIENKIDEKKDREAAEAKEKELKRQDGLAWNKAVEENIISAYNSYLDNEDFKIHREDAIKAIDVLQWKQVLENKNLEGFKTYIDSGKNESNITEAKKYVKYWNEEEIDFSDLEEKSKIDDLEYYVQAIEIDISKNNLTSLPENIGNLEKLRKLEISNNILNRLPESITSCTNLEELVIEKNSLEILPKNIRGLKNLKVLKLSSNKLKNLPSKIGKLDKLEDLYLNKNSLEELPDSFSDLEGLKRLDLSDNKLNKLPDEFGDLESLETLRIVNSGITSFPESFANLNLKILYIDKETLKEAKDVLKVIKKQNKDFEIKEIKIK